jgi:ABC-type antimicrobial peptide transport system permease subunit
VRTAGDVTLVAREIHKEIATVDPFIPISDVDTLDSRLAKVLAYPRFRAMVLAFFALSAMILSAVGLHGVLSQLVAQRIPEFGIRRAVGAQTGDLIWLIARQGGVPVVAGLAAGVCLTLAFNRVLVNLLYGIQTANPSVLAIVGLALLGAAAPAILLPARRAARVDPMIALRDE